MKGIYVPLVTPFSEQSIDEEAIRGLVNYYIEKGVHGLVPLGTTGESPCVNDEEYDRIIRLVVEETDGRVPVYAGYGGNDTQKVIKGLRKLRRLGVDGILSVSPYYNRPSQEGIYRHFMAIAEGTELPIILYNIPYRTGRNMTNETIIKLAAHPQIVALKDACGDITQSIQLLSEKPSDFSILCGDDIQFYTHLALGADGGILASAHIETEKFLRIFHLMERNNYQKALELFKPMIPMLKLLFEEPNPAPIKYLLQQQGQISWDHVRLPLISITDELKEQLKVYYHQNEGVYRFDLGKAES